MEINITAAREAMREVVAEKGADYVYPRSYLEGVRQGSCVNVERTEMDELVPSCIVGHALHRLGVPLEDLEPCAEEAVGSLVDSLSLDLDPGLEGAFNEAQLEQDRGAPWGLVLQMFEDALQ